MSYFVIKGPHDGGNYLCSMPEQATPQWYTKGHAIKFPDADSAWKFIELCAERGHARVGRVVRVNTIRDWKAERAQLRASRDHWQAVAEMRAELLRTADDRMREARKP